MSLEIVELKKDELDEYDRLVEISSEGTIFHKSWWLNCFKDVYRYRYEVKYVGVYQNDGNLISAIPIPIHKRGFINFIYPPKLTPYLGSVFYPENVKYYSLISKRKKINKEFVYVMKDCGITVLYPFSHDHVDLQPYKWRGFSIEVSYTYVIDLNQPLDVIWDGMHSSRRRDIRKAEKSNIQIAENDLISFLELNEETFRRQKKRINLKKFWKIIFNECSKRNCCKIWTAYLNNEPIASLFLIWDNKRAYYIGGGINQNSQGIMSLLMWNAIKASKEMGLKEFDFEGSDIPTIEMYFRKFGGTIRPILYIRDKSVIVDIIVKLRKHMIK